MKQAASILLSLAVGGLSAAQAAVEITGLRCEYMSEPMGVETPAPRFTWHYAGEGPLPSDPTVEIATDSLFRHPVKIKATDPFRAVCNRIKAFRPQTRYWWRVTAREGDKRVVSPLASFETGKLSARNWQARWISDGKGIEEPAAPLFRKEFTLTELPREARAYVSAVGYYDMYVNGQRVTDSHMDPGYTDYTRRSLYATHDITPLLREGVNEITVTLGNGFANNQNHDVWNQEHAHWRTRPQLICEIDADGRTVAASDSSWQTALSPTFYNNIYSGDHVDCRVIPSEWSPAVETSAKSALLQSQTMHPIRPVESIRADRLRSFGDTLFIFDMGKNIAGVTSMRLKGKKGTSVKIRHGEILKSNGRVERGNVDIYYHPARDDEEFQTDLIVLSGKEEGDSVHPRFTYHGFRYVEVIADAPVEVENVTGQFMRTALPRVGTFRCSDPLLNRIHDATMLSYEGNIHSIPTDCPQREKNGWTADAHVAVQLGLLNYDDITLYEKWMRDFADAQRESGNIPGIVPSPGWGYGDWPGPVWDAALFIIPTALYDYYGDDRAIRELYPTMKNYFGWVQSLRQPDGSITCGIGDWLSPGAQTPTEFTSTLYYYVDNKLMARIAAIMGDDPTPYIEEMNRTRDLINSQYFDREKALYAGGTQAAQGIALYWDVVPEDQRQRVADRLNDMIVDAGYRTNFGLLGSKSVLRMLTRYGHLDTAMRIATSTSAPSWGYWLEKCGQTTLAETWTMDPNFRDASVNHVFFGDIAAWMTNDLAGLAFDPSAPGFANVIVNPHFPEELEWAEATYDSVKGPVKVSWRRRTAQAPENSGVIDLTVTLPPGVTATLFPGTPAERRLASSATVTI